MARTALQVGQVGTSLNAATAVGAGDEFGFQPRPGADTPITFGWEVVITGGPVTMQADLQGSLDGTNWYQIDTYNTPGTNTLRAVVDKRVKFVRANLIALTGGTTPTVTVRIFGG